MISQTFLSETDMRLSWSSHAGGGLPAAALRYWVQACLSECQQTLPSSKLMVNQGEPTRTLQYILSLSLLTQAAQQIWKLQFKRHSRKAEMEQPSPHTSFCCCPGGHQPTARLREQAEGASQCPPCSWRSPGVVAVGSRLGWAAPNAVCHLG